MLTGSRGIIHSVFKLSISIDHGMANVWCPKYRHTLPAEPEAPASAAPRLRSRPCFGHYLQWHQWRPGQLE
eukprot:9746469-Lingulodinium_polyedra.AAC.1